MKKLLLMLVIICAPVLFTSCSEDPINDVEPKFEVNHVQTPDGDGEEEEEEGDTSGAMNGGN